MPIKKFEDINQSEITPENVYLSRRNFIKSAVLLGSTVATGGLYRWLNQPPPVVPELAKIEDVAQPNETTNGFTVDETKTLYKDITSYNNYYEFGTDKYSPARLAGSLQTRPWTIEVGGLVQKPQTFGIEDLLRFAQEERVYRHRCVEGWSMVIPW
ncbi:MAG: molybdopterin-dependent oxidoreductase, partial [Pyrinomonadaceae bacterium]